MPFSSKPLTLRWLVTAVTVDVHFLRQGRLTIFTNQKQKYNKSYYLFIYIRVELDVHVKRAV